jgi:hypothetical protein
MAAKSRGRGGGSSEEVLALLEAAQNLLEKDRDPPKGRLTMQLEIRYKFEFYFLVASPG